MDKDSIKVFETNKQAVIDFLSKIHLVESEGEIVVGIDTAIERDEASIFAVYSAACGLLTASAIQLSDKVENKGEAITDLTEGTDVTLVDLLANRLASSLAYLQKLSNKDSDLYVFGDILEGEKVYSMFRTLSEKEYSQLTEPTKEDETV